jgi:hypothetical protein
LPPDARIAGVTPVKGDNGGNTPLGNGKDTGKAVVCVDEIEVAVAEHPTKVDAGLCIRALPLTAVEGENLDFYPELAHVFDQISNETTC